MQRDEPIEMTDAATMPVAASSAPTKITAKARLRSGPKSWPMERETGHAASLEDQSHEGEEGHREQRTPTSRPQ
jgi:hypothetical protein